MRIFLLTLLMAISLLFFVVPASVSGAVLEVKGVDLSLLLPAAPGSMYPDLSNLMPFSEQCFFMSRGGYLMVWAQHRLGTVLTRAEANAIIASGAAGPDTMTR